MMKSAIYLRQPGVEDRRTFLEAVHHSKLLHRRWVNAPATSLQSHAYLVCRRDTGQFAGVINLTNVIMGAFRSGYLGYYAFAGQERRGYMREGLRAVVVHAFRSLKLHRLEANIQPGNRASLALAQACGFAREGYSPRYLKIGGRWRDHERWAILAS
jgi:ribosomal-protein-alanine N-acetyltransferase